MNKSSGVMLELCEKVFIFMTASDSLGMTDGPNKAKDLDLFVARFLHKKGLKTDPKKASLYVQKHFDELLEDEEIRIYFINRAIEFHLFSIKKLTDSLCAIKTEDRDS